MVEFVIGRNIKAKGDKVIVAVKDIDISKYLNADEQKLLPATKKQTPEEKLKMYHLGSYSLAVIFLKKDASAVGWQNVGGNTWKHIKKMRDVKIVLVNQKPEAYYNFALGLELASYSFDKYFTKKPASYYPTLERIVFCNSGLKNFDGYKPNAALATAVRYARDLISEPASVLTPEVMAADIKRLEYLGLEVEILDEKQMQEHGFGLASAVGQGSCNKPRIAIIKWRGQCQEDKFSVGLVGKGVTFDSGGISIKPAANMGDMKQDMAGAAAVVAAMKALALQKSPHNVVAVVGLVENMPSGSAYRPGDVVKSMSGQTVEVINTDAEGRLVLADCLTYIQKTYTPEYVVDMATLTGAIVIALGSVFAGLFTNSQSMVKGMTQAGEACGERVWPMPTDIEYNKLIDSDIADMKNTGGRSAGSSTAACFLRRFIEKNTKWAHID
ncbi:MAG: leucyl aminopeptidase, partial [Alphaproteobacteria bacterium]